MRLLIILFALQTLNCLAQVTEEWVTRYNGTGNSGDDGNYMVIDGSGNVYVTGHSIGSGTFGDYATVKYNSAGVQQWISRYNGPADYFERPFAIAVDGSGNVYVTGRSTGIGTAYDFATIKYNASGDSVWVRRYNGPGNGDDEAHSIAVDGSENVYITGWSTGNGTDKDYATIKYNSSGVQQWAQRYNGPGNGWDEPLSIAIDGFGYVYVTGRSGVLYSDYCTIKYNFSGGQQWIQSYNGTGDDDDVALSIAVDGSGNVYVTGVSPGAGTVEDYATIKYNSTGVQQWVQRYNGPGNDWDIAYSVVVDDLGNVYVTGKSPGNGTNSDYATIKYNSAGVQHWAARYNGPGNGWDEAYSIALDGLGNVYVTGESLGNGTNYDYTTIKYGSTGIQQWVQRYNGLGNGSDAPHSVAVDGSGNVFVTGESTGSGTGLDFVTIKYSQTIGIQPILNAIPNQYSLSQNFPNPFNPSTKISFDIAKSSYVELKIFDVQGKHVAVLVNEQLQPGIYEVQWDAVDYPSGIYYYKLNVVGFTDTKKMVLIK